VQQVQIDSLIAGHGLTEPSRRVRAECVVVLRIVVRRCHVDPVVLQGPSGLRPQRGRRRRPLRQESAGLRGEFVQVQRFVGDFRFYPR